MNLPVKNKLKEDLFRIKPMKPVIKTTLPHGHKDYLEIIYLQEGRGHHQIDHRKFAISPATVYWVLPGQVHHWELTDIPKGFVIMLRKDFLADHPLYDLLFSPFPLPFPHAVELSHIEPAITGIFEAMEKEFRDLLPNFKAIVQSYLWLLFNLMKREAKQEHSALHPELLIRFIEVLDQNFAMRYPVGQYARILNVTPKTLNQVCRKSLGKTAGQFINEKITREAQKQLLYSTDSLSEIAYRLGFSDLSHFNKFFKKQTGLLPGGYRRSIA